MKKEFLNFSKVSYEEAKEFGKNQRNRKINRGNLQKIKKQMLESFDVIPPITVNAETMNIIDGQTRHKAFVELHEEGRIPSDWELKVMFVSIPEEDEIDAIINANTNSKNWSCDDYFESYVKGDNMSYVNLDYFCKHHELTFDSVKKKTKFRYGAAMVKGRECQEELKHGTFTCTEEELKTGDKVHNEILEILETIGWPKKVHWIGAMAIKWHEFRAKRPFSDWMKTIRSLSKRASLLRLNHENQADWDVVFSYILSKMDDEKKAA